MRGPIEAVGAVDLPDVNRLHLGSTDQLRGHRGRHLPHERSRDHDQPEDGYESERGGCLAARTGNRWSASVPPEAREPRPPLPDPEQPQAGQGAPGGGQSLDRLDRPELRLERPRSRAPDRPAGRDPEHREGEQRRQPGEGPAPPADGRADKNDRRRHAYE